VIAFARECRRRGGPLLAVPAKPIDSFLVLVTLLANETGEPFGPDGGFADPDRAAAALDRLSLLLQLCHPASSGANPIELLELMSTTDEVAYLPLTFGYVNYATPGFRRHQVAFGPVPAGARGSAGGVLGGAGLGVSARSANIGAAADLAAFVASGPVQRGPYVAGGGQPGHRSAWLDPGVDERHGRFFTSTLPGIDGAYLRPRWAGWLPAQTVAAAMVHGWLTGHHGGADLIVRDINAHLVAARAARKGSEPHAH
jgi:multiple sugar transport system substrate-binding protein